MAFLIMKARTSASQRTKLSNRPEYIKIVSTHSHFTQLV